MDTDRAHVVYIIGKRRSGKSYTLGAIAEGLVSKQWINQMSEPQAVLVFDTLNVFWGMQYAAVFGGSENTQDLLNGELKRKSFQLIFTIPEDIKWNIIPLNSANSP